MHKYRLSIMHKKTASSQNTKWFFITGLLLAVCMLVINATNAQQAPQTMHWKVGDDTRDALVCIPPTAKTKPTPVIFVFHGHGGSMQYMYRSRGFEKLWPEAIVIYPQGLNTAGQLTDPEGKLPGWQKAPGDMNDRDLLFFDAMLQTIKQDYKIDEKRIYATGHSNGGGFTYLLWATRGDVFAAVAPSSAAALRYANLLKPKPALHIMGQTDPLVKPEWQKAMCDKILKLNGCSKTGEPYATNATLYASATGTPVVLYVHPGGHTYPPDADAVIIQFFKSMIKP